MNDPEDLQQTPLAITAITDAELEVRSDTSLADGASQATNVTLRRDYQMPAARDRKSMFSIHSPAFMNNALVPRKYTAAGENVSPPLEWSGAPAGTMSFVLIVENPEAPDPHARRRTQVHWVLYDLPADMRSLPENVDSQGLPAGCRQGLNDSKHTAYSGPPRAVGRHRCVHRIYALDTLLPMLHHPSRAQLMAAMQGHVISRAELVGMLNNGR